MGTKIKKYDVGVIIGRYQVHELHDGHKHLIDSVLENSKVVVILVGVSSTLGTKRDPLNYVVRERMLRHYYPQIHVAPLLDHHSDEEWSKQVDRTIRALCPIGSVALYGSRDSFIPYYSGLYETIEIEPYLDEAGTMLRAVAGFTVEDTVDFRKGIIYSTQNTYHRIHQTVDVAVCRNVEGVDAVLMGKRPNLEGLRFFGGFVNPTDSSLEDAARRELHEEVDVEIGNKLTYIGSNLQADWRYKTDDDRIMTAFYKADYIYGHGKPKDSEFAKTEWIQISENMRYKVEKAHWELFSQLVRSYNEG